MKVAVWRTGHEIANTVAESIARGCVNRADTVCFATPDHKAMINASDIHLAYGILRGTADVFRECDAQGKPWFNIDRGYFRPNHYDGYYRISLRGTQQTTGLYKLEPDYHRLEALRLDIKPWRGFDTSKPILVIPPTEPVRAFFNFTGMQFEKSGVYGSHVVRTKDCATPIVFDDYSHVITFNSSVGWQALMAGIPCMSGDKSIVGAWFKNVSIDSLSEKQEAERMKLFAVMASLQLTLDEMRAGKIWELMNRLLSTSATIAESR